LDQVLALGGRNVGDPVGERVEGAGESVGVEPAGSGVGELRLELRLACGQLLEFGTDLVEALSAGLLWEGAAHACR
jgi:hypothetical protein